MLHKSLKSLAAPILIFVLPTAWLLSGRYQLFPPIGWIDPDLYIHWFTSPVQNAARVGLDYHGARLPFVLVGFAFYHLLGPVAAQRCLVVACYALGLGGLYSLVSAILKTLPARLVAHWAICFNPLWIAAFVQGYVDGTTIAFGLLAMGLLLSDRTHPPKLALAGMWLALAVSTQPFGGGVAGLSVGAILVARMPGRLEMLKAALCIAFGAVLATVLLGAAGTLLGLPFFYLGVSRSAMSNALAGFDAHYTTPVASWIAARFRLAIVPAIAAPALLEWAMPWRRESVDRPRRRALMAAALIPLAVFFALLAHSAFLFEFRFYASYLLLALAPSMTLLVARFEAGIPVRIWWWAAGAVLGVSLLAAAVGPSPGEARDGRIVWSLIAILSALAAGGLAWRPAAGLVVLAAALTVAGTTNDDTAAIFYRRGLPSFQAQQRQLAALRRALDAFGIAPGRFLIWFGRDAFTDQRHLGPAETYRVTFMGQVLRLNALDSLAAATAGWDASSLGFGMPALDDVSRQNMWRLLPGPSTVVLLCAVEGECAAGVETLIGAGFKASGRRSTDIAVPGAPAFHLVAVTVKRAG